MLSSLFESKVLLNQAALSVIIANCSSYSIIHLEDIASFTLYSLASQATSIGNSSYYQKHRHPSVLATTQEHNTSSVSADQVSLDGPQTCQKTANRQDLLDSTKNNSHQLPPSRKRRYYSQSTRYLKLDNRATMVSNILGNQ